MTEPDRLREVAGHFATGVAVVTCLASDGPRGLTTNAVASLSLEPPLMLACFDNASRTLPAVRETGRFAVNILAANQRDVSAVFASKIPPEQKFATAAFRIEHGAPVLEGVLAWIVCDLLELHRGGDHTIGIGEVVALHHVEGRPLLWFRGAYTGLPDG